jgi:hypothetical protein
LASRLFPVGDADFDRIKGAVRLVYGRGVRGRLRGVADLVRGFAGRR